MASLPIANVFRRDSPLAGPADPQSSSLLMTRLPAEIRNDIFRLALTEYVDTAAPYEWRTYHVRPGYMGPLRTDTELLRTCRAIYRDCWLMPHLNRDETFWLVSWDDRQPPEYNHWDRLRALRNRLRLVLRRLGKDDAVPLIELRSLRVFAQLRELQMGHRLKTLIGMTLLRFRSLTITIRFTDWRDWEDGARPSMRTSAWVGVLHDVLPETTEEVVMELESLERDKDLLDTMAETMSRRWFFKRTDGLSLVGDTSTVYEAPPDPDDGGAEVQHNSRSSGTKPGRSAEEQQLVNRWFGSSSFGDTLYDEFETTKPGFLSYYIVKVPFRLQPDVEARGGKVNMETVQAADADNFEWLYRGVP